MSKTKNFFIPFDASESSEKRVGKLKQWFNRSRIKNLISDTRYWKKKKTRREARQAALVREHYREEREKNKFYQ